MNALNIQNALPQSPIMNSLASGPNMNTRENIIAGPGPRDYWFHSPGAQIPLINEEGPFPVQGNIGALLKQENTDYQNCGTGPDIGSSPNCTGTFQADAYTTTDTCGAECQLKYPESYGLKDFGFPEDMPSSQKVTNAHSLHSFANIRAGQAGQVNTTGCYEWEPSLTANPNTGSCDLSQNPVYTQVGAWNFLPMYSNLQSVRYTPFKPEEPVTDVPMTPMQMRRRR